MNVADQSVFLRKRGDKKRLLAERRKRDEEKREKEEQRATQQASRNVSNANTPSADAGTATLGVDVKVESKPVVTPSTNAQNISRIHLVSYGPVDGQRFNIMRMNVDRELNPRAMSQPLMLNRKHTGPRAPPQYAFSGDGELLGRYVYDVEGKAVLGSDGKPVIERKEGMDMSLVGQASGSAPKRKLRKTVKDVYQQDIDVLRLKREENIPWVLESESPKERSGRTVDGPPEHWVGRMQEPNPMPSVLFIHDGGAGGFRVALMGRTYRFDPERPFKALDPDAAHKLFEYQTKHKLHDRWAQRDEAAARQGSGDVVMAEGLQLRVKQEAVQQATQEDRASRLEHRMQRIRVAPGRVKQERFDDDSKREGRGMQRGLEGGFDEELDYDMNDDFQDDDDNNELYRNEDEEEDSKRVEERLKKEFKLANANVGDQPQIADEDADDDLFGDRRLDAEGKKLKRTLKKRNGTDAFDSDSDEDDSDASDSQSVKSAKSTKSTKSAQNETAASTPRSVDVPSRPESRSDSRGPKARGKSSPNGRQLQPPPGGRGRTDPLPSSSRTGSGAALIAQRAAGRGASVQRSRQGSPSGQASTPPTRDGSPARAMSPNGDRASSPQSRDSSPAPSTSSKGPSGPFKTPRPNTTAPQSPGGTPGRGGGPKKRANPSLSPSASDDGSRKRKKGSATPQPAPPALQPFEGMITEAEVVDWLKQQPDSAAPMQALVKAFKPRLVATSPEHLADNSALLVRLVREVTVQKDKIFRLKDGR